MVASDSPGAQFLNKGGYMRKQLLNLIFVSLFISSAVWACPDVIARVGDQIIVKRNGKYFIEQGGGFGYSGQSAYLESTPNGLRIYDQQNNEYVLIRGNGDTCRYSASENEDQACGSGSQY